jgi:ferredoxin
MPESPSGNAVNGLGETRRRRPTPVMWHRPDKIAHGAIQDYVNRSFEDHPKLGGIFNVPERRAKPVPIADKRAERSPEEWTALVKQFALDHESDLVGIARVEDHWFFECAPASGPFIIVSAVAMDYETMQHAPEPDAAVEVATQYNRGTRTARTIANFIREQGYEAEGHGGPYAGPVNLLPAALAAGLGELGKHGSIINRSLGSCLRLAGVLTDLPLIPDEPVDIGAADFCAACQVCTNACPPGAISADKKMVRGTEKYYVDFDLCMPYFAAHHGCGICVAVCPWSRPGTGPLLSQKMLRRRARRDEQA